MIKLVEIIHEHQIKKIIVGIVERAAARTAKGEIIAEIAEKVAIQGETTAVNRGNNQAEIDNLRCKSNLRTVLVINKR